MRFGTAFAMAVLTLGLGACASMEWAKPDSTPEQAEADSLQCQRDAWQEAHRYWYYRPFGPMGFRDALGRPLFGGPYGVGPDPFADPALQESRLAMFCMRSKGYELVPSGKN